MLMLCVFRAVLESQTFLHGNAFKLHHLTTASHRGLPRPIFKVHLNKRREKVYAGTEERKAVASSVNGVIPRSDTEKGAWEPDISGHVVTLASIGQVKDLEERLVHK